MIKLIVSDIDGTLVPEGSHDINPELMEVIVALKDKGIQFAAASGRHWSSIDRVFAPIRERIFYIADNGGYIGLYKRPLFLETIKREAAMELVREMKEIPDMDIVISSPSVAYMDSKNQKFIDWIQEGYLYNVQMVDNILNVDDDILKVACYYEGGLDRLEGHLREKYGQYGNVTISGAAWLDYMPYKINKGYAVKVLQDNLDIKPEETMVFGDQMNDMEMIDQAYYSFAVASARKEVREAARFLADRSDRDGVLKVLKTLL